MSINYCNCNICKKYFELNKKRFIEDRYCIMEIINFNDSFDKCEGYYKNNMKYECKNNNYYCIGCGFHVDFNNAESKEIFNEMCEILHDHDSDDNCEFEPYFEDFIDGEVVEYKCCNHCKKQKLIETHKN